jgi:hypothetical protein
VLESLEQEYKREEDWCGGADKLGPNSESDHVTPMISKHLEQKEAFLKACTLARRNADVFLKYLHRNSVNMPGMLSHVKAPETQVKSKCLFFSFPIKYTLDRSLLWCSFQVPSSFRQMGCVPNSPLFPL